MLKKKILASNYIFVSTHHSKKKVDKYLKELNFVFQKISKIEKGKKNLYLKDEAKFFKK